MNHLPEILKFGEQERQGEVLLVHADFLQSSETELGPSECTQLRRSGGWSQIQTKPIKASALQCNCTGQTAAGRSNLIFAPKVQLTRPP